MNLTLTDWASAPQPYNMILIFAYSKSFLLVFSTAYLLSEAALVVSILVSMILRLFSLPNEIRICYIGVLLEI
jgi:hypothetical protein